MTSLPDSKPTRSGSSILFPNYVSSRTLEAPKVIICKNANYLLVKLAIPKGVNVKTNIIPNLKNVEFIDHDLCKFPKLVMNRYMCNVLDTQDGIIHMVLMGWSKGLHKYGLLLFMHTPHFGHTQKVKMCMKQLLVFFHGGCIWLD